MKKALEQHKQWRGKVGIFSKAPVKNVDDLQCRPIRLAVAEPLRRELASNPGQRLELYLEE